MLYNPLHGEITLVINQTPRRLRLTLGALAALENRLGAGSLMELAERFETGRVPAADLTALLAAALYGGGESMTEDDLAKADIEGGAANAMRIGMALLVCAFQPPEGSDSVLGATDAESVSG